MDRNIADRQLTERLIKENFKLPLKQTCVVGGFISRDRDTDVITNLGRGGSDYTAALIAAALDADLLEIWTDVDGFMTSDPRIIKDAQVIPYMTFVESMELCSFGAKVIYPPTIYPVFHKNIPIKILNTHNPQTPGTLIADNSRNLPAHVRGVSSVRGISMLTISGRLSSNMPEVNSRTYNAMARGGVPVLLVTQGEDSNDFSISLLSQYADKAAEILDNEFAPELGSGDVDSIRREDRMSVIAVVKEGIKSIEGLGARLCHTLHRNGVPVKGISDGVSESTIAIIVPQQDADNALRYVHGAVIPPAV
jgi:aspartate kinase